MSDRSSTRAPVNSVEPPPPPPARSPLQAALALDQLGWSVFPLCHPTHDGNHTDAHVTGCKRPGKMPVIRWKRCQTVRLTPEELSAHWGRNPAYNLAVVTGKVSGIVMVDIDTDRGAERWVELAGPDAVATWEFGTGRGGRHLVFGWDDARPPKGNPFPGLKGDLDFLGEGHFSAVPPSLHKARVRYRWTAGGPGSDLPLAAAPGWLVAAVLAPPAGKQRTRLGEGNGATPVYIPPGTTRRAAAWARGFEPAVQGQGGRNIAFKLACSLIHGFGLSADETLSVMLDHWNGRCVPPWDDEDLRERVESARDNGHFDPIPERPTTTRSAIAASSSAPASLPAGVVLLEEPIEEVLDRAEQGLPAPARKKVIRHALNGPPPNGHGPHPVAAARPSPNGRTNERPAGRTENGEEPLPGVFTFGAEDVLPTEWFLEPYIPRAMVTILVGEKGGGKSTFATMLMGQAGKTVFFPGEEDIKRMALPRALESGVDPKKVCWVPSSPEWMLPTYRDRLIRLIREKGADLVVFDPLDDYLADGIDENNNQQVRALLQCLREVAEATGAAVVIIRHPGKGIGNVMVASRAWGNHPRAIIQFIKDADVRDRGTILAYKPPLGRDFPPREYNLVGAGGRFKRFVFAGVVDAAKAREAEEVPDRIDRTKISRAEEWLRAILADGPWDSRDIYAAGERVRFGDRILQRAAERLDLDMKRYDHGKNHRCMWSLPPAPPGG